MPKSQIPVPSSGYYGVRPEKVDWAQESVAAIFRNLITAKKILRESGACLRELKQVVPPRRWREFVAKELRLQIRSVQLYMAIAVAAENYDPDIIRRLPINAAAALGSKRTPPTVALKIIADVRSGKRVSVDNVRLLVAKSKSGTENAAPEPNAFVQMASIVGGRLSDDELEIFVRLLNKMSRAEVQKFCKLLKLHQMSK